MNRALMWICGAIRFKTSIAFSIVSKSSDVARTNNSPSRSLKKMLFPGKFKFTPSVEKNSRACCGLVGQGALTKKQTAKFASRAEALLGTGPTGKGEWGLLIADAKTVVWNGPMGVFEIEAFAAGTNAVARAVAAVKGTTIIGGGDSIAAIKKAGLADRITHISTGGGASLEFLGGRTLPGVAALTDV